MSTQKMLTPKLLKWLSLIIIGLGVFVWMFWYVNTYLYNFFAGANTVAINFTPTAVTTTSGSEFNVSVLMSDQKISAAELIIEFDGNLLDYATEYSGDGSTGFSQTTPYFEKPLIESVTVNGNKKTLKLVLVTFEKNQTTDAKQIGLKFKAKAAGTGTVKIIDMDGTVHKTKVSGINAQSDPMYFEKNIPNDTVTVTIGAGGAETPTTEPTLDPSGNPTTSPTAEPPPSGPSIHVDMKESTLPRQEVGNDFDIGVTLSGQSDVAAVELYVAFQPDEVQYATEFSPSVSGFTQQGDYFEEPILEKLTAAGNLKLALISLSDKPLPDGYTINLKFKGIAQGVSQIRLSGNTKVSGVYNNNAVFFNVISSTSVTSVPVGVDPGDITPQPSNLTPEPTVIENNPNSKNVYLNMKLKLQGITDNPKNSTETIPVEVILLSEDRQTRGVATLNFKPVGNGVWASEATTSASTYSLNLSKKYSVYVKGPKHLRKRICTSAPQESLPGGYQCSKDVTFGSLSQIDLKAGENNLDFSNIVMLAGDIPEQNGVVDAVDFSFIRQNFGSQDENIMARGDLNYDGIVDTQDYSLVLAALAFKYDEE